MKMEPYGLVTETVFFFVLVFYIGNINKMETKSLVTEIDVHWRQNKN